MSKYTNLIKDGFNPIPEIMVPLVGSENELADQKSVIIKKAKQVEKKNNVVNTIIKFLIVKLELKFDNY